MTTANSPEVPLIPCEGWQNFAPLVERRRSLGFTQGEVAGVMGTSAPLVCTSERGQRRITPRFRERYAEALDRLEGALRARERVGSTGA